MHYISARKIEMVPAAVSSGTSNCTFIKQINIDYELKQHLFVWNPHS